MHHCWVRLSVCTGACMYSTCASFAVCEMWIFMRVRVCVCARVSLGVCLCAYASSIHSLLFALHLCMYACVVLLPVCLSACAPFNWRNSLADPASHTSRQLECWIIWAISGHVSLWALLYIHCRHGRKKRGFATTAVVPWLHALQTKHIPTEHGQQRSDTTPQCHLVTD